MTRGTLQSGIIQELVEQQKLVQGNPCPACSCELYHY